MSAVIVALDFPSAKLALALAEQLDPRRCRLKVGKELFTVAGPDLIERLHRLGFSVFLDLKFHDIPNTVARAVSAAQSLGVWMVNVHAGGGPEMLAAARDAVGKDCLLIGVTVLTSMDESSLRALGINRSMDQQVLALAQLCVDARLDGVVCSAHEAGLLKSNFGKDFKLVTPGVRLNALDTDDQKRVMTPQMAIKAGSDYLVIGRAITTSPEPLKTLNKIITTLGDDERG